MSLSEAAFPPQVVFVCGYHIPRVARENVYRPSCLFDCNHDCQEFCSWACVCLTALVDLSVEGVAGPPENSGARASEPRVLLIMAGAVCVYVDIVVFCFQE